MQTSAGDSLLQDVAFYGRHCHGLQVARNPKGYGSSARYLEEDGVPCSLHAHRIGSRTHRDVYKTTRYKLTIPGLVSGG